MPRGFRLNGILPAAQLSKETHDVVRLGTAMPSLLASLVLGLLIATVKTSYDATDNAVRAYAADLIVLDETLRDYGEGALASRRLLRDYTNLILRNVWPDHGGGSPFLEEHADAGRLMERVRDFVRALEPVNGDQRWLSEQALQIGTSLLRQRWLMIERSGPSVRAPVIVILVFWIVAIFLSFGIAAPRNATVQAAFFICALAIGSSIYLVLELDSPFAGLMRISSHPMQSAVAHMLPSGK